MTGADLPPIPDVLRQMRALDFDGRTRYLQSLIGPRTLSPSLLHRRALLVTALNVAELWPQRVKR